MFLKKVLLRSCKRVNISSYIFFCKIFAQQYRNAINSAHTLLACSSLAGFNFMRHGTHVLILSKQPNSIVVRNIRDVKHNT